MRRQRGFTLAESLLAVTLLAICVTAITLPFTAGAQHDLEDARQALATTLAAEMMDEVLSKPFEDPDGASSPGPEAGESGRSQFDNLDDYHGLTEAEWSIVNRFGSLTTDPIADGLSRSVSVEYVTVSGQDGSDAPTFVKITVTVYHHDRSLLTLTRLRYAYS